MSQHDAERLAREFKDLMSYKHRIVRTGPSWTFIVERLLEKLRRIAKETGEPIRVQERIEAPLPGSLRVRGAWCP